MDPLQIIGFRESVEIVKGGSFAKLLISVSSINQIFQELKIAARRRNFSGDKNVTLPPPKKNTDSITWDTQLLGTNPEFGELFNYLGRPK